MQDCTQPAFNDDSSLPAPFPAFAGKGTPARPALAPALKMRELRDQVEDLRLECQAAFDNVAVGVLVVRQGIVDRCNLRLAGMYGCEVQELTGAPAARFPFCARDGAGKDVFTVETSSQRKDGATIWVRSTAHLLHAPEGGDMTVWIVEDITEHKRAEHTAREARCELALFEARTRELELLNETLRQEVLARTEAEQRSWHAAHHDALTGLANRMMLTLHMDHALRLAQRHRTGVALMYIDLDRFKSINDSLGHQVGDGFLRTVADRLQHAIRVTDLAARIGGDEFVIVLQDQQHIDDAVLVARKVMDALAEPMQVDGHTLHAMASIGISLFPEHGHDLDTLLRHADTAMYRAKASGRNAFCVFEAER